MKFYHFLIIYLSINFAEKIVVSKNENKQKEDGVGPSFWKK